MVGGVLWFFWILWLGKECFFELFDFEIYLICGYIGWVEVEFIGENVLF